MSKHAVPLNTVQLEVLTWVKDGCPADVYSDWTHRVSARALHNRGLIKVRGHGSTWSATLTDDGRYYLEHGSYPGESPDGQADSSHRKSVVDAEQSDEPAAREATSPSPPPRQARTTSRAKQPNKTDQFMLTLDAADGHQLVVESSEETSYRRLASLAKRRGLIPEGMQITLSRPSYDQLTVTLEPLPEWQTRVLDPISVPVRLHDPSDVTSALSESETFQVVGGPRKRALRLAEALIVTARDRGMSVKAVLNQPRNRNYYSYHDSPRRDEIEFTIEHDSFRLWFTQETLKEPHEPTPREIARVRRGFLFPDHDYVPAQQLGLVLDGEGGTFWGSSWHDTDEHALEEDLAQILEEIRLRHEHQIERREAEHEREIARREQLDKDRIAARAKYRRKFVADAMKDQAKNW
ncbi:MAG: hypothetical protein LBS56_05195, partial [Propionibacteriaceae bacterium]|nr:hypothetical protein [Propionibacteriaceae bacterium]